MVDTIYSRTSNYCKFYQDQHFAHCNTSLHILEQIIPTLHKKDQNLRHILGHKRQKRAWLNIVGSAFKTIFGTLDEDDAERYNDAINSVKINDKHMSELLKQQIQVVQSTITNFNSSITSFERNRVIFDTNFQKLSNMTKTLKSSIFNLELKQVLEEHFALFILLVTELQHELNLLTDSIIFAHSNSIHPSVISPNQYIEELQKSVPSLPPSLTYALPINIKNSHELIKLTTIKCFINQDRIMFIISNPLVEEIMYSIYKLIPLPVKQAKTNNYIFILPSTKYIATDHTKNFYFFIEPFNHCQHLNSLMLCINNEPIYSSHIKPICETELLFPITQIPRNCDHRIIPNLLDIWHKLDNKNQWIYVLYKETDVTINCRSPDKGYTLSHLILKDTGIIKLNLDCKLYTSSTTLVAQTTHLESQVKAIIPNMTIDDNICCEKINKLNLTKMHISLSKPMSLNVESLHIASHKLEQLNKLADEYETPSMFENVTSNSYFTYIICTIVKILVLYLVYKLFKRIRNKCKHNTGCQRISNCLTLNICKRKSENNVELELELENTPETSNETTPVRRSLRIAKLKEKI